MSIISKKFDKTVGVNPDLDTMALHLELQRMRQSEGENVSLKQFLAETWGEDLTPDKFYQQLGIDMTRQTVSKMLETSQLTRGLFPEVFRDAIIRGLEYAPFYPELITGNEAIESTGVTMPSMRFDTVDPNTYRLRHVNEGATIPEADVIAWGEKQVTVRKKARGLKQTYESIMFTPIDLARIYFEELGARLGADLDSDFINILINGDQADASETSPVMGGTDGVNLTYTDLARAWIRFRRIGRNPVAIICNEAEALNLLLMTEFQKTRIPNGIPANATGTDINVRMPLPTDQDIFIHSSVPAKQLIMVDKARAVAQLTAMPLLVETEKIVSRQITGEYVSLMTGFANVFTDGRLILNYGTNLSTNPGPTVPV